MPPTNNSNTQRPEVEDMERGRHTAPLQGRQMTVDVSIPNAMRLDVPLPDQFQNVQAITLRLLAIDPPTGGLLIYGEPYDHPPYMLDMVLQPQIDVPTTSPTLYVQKVAGAKDFGIAVVFVTADRDGDDGLRWKV